MIQILYKALTLSPPDTFLYLYKTSDRRLYLSINVFVTLFSCIKYVTSDRP